MNDEQRCLGPAAQMQLPDVIHLPDQSQPPAAAIKAAGRKGWHFGGRRVENPRTAFIPPTRCTPDFRAEIEAKARAAGMTIGGFIISALGGMPSPKSRPKASPDVAWRVKVLAELGKSGGNLNQIAAQMNSYDFRGIPQLIQMAERPVKRERLKPPKSGAPSAPLLEISSLRKSAVFRLIEHR